MKKTKTGKNLEGRIGEGKKRKKREEQRKKGRQRRGKREEKKGIVVKKKGKYPYFVSLFNIGPYDRQKKSPKIGKNFRIFQALIRSVQRFAS